MKLYNFVYKTTNLINNKYYIGVHSTDDLDDGYLGSGKLLKRALKKYSKENFKREILHFCESMDAALAKEKEIVDLEFVKCESNYNVAIGGSGGGLFGQDNPFFGKRHSEETKETIRAKNSGKICTDEMRLKISKGLKESEKWNLVMSDPNRGKRISESLKASESHKIAMASEEVREKIRHSKMIYWEEHPEARIKVSETQLELWQNKEYKERMLEIFNSDERNAKLSTSIKKWISENPEAHMERMLKINKNPEKIRKMAEKHRGMKRTDDAKKNISSARFGKGKGPRNSEFKGYYITPIGKFSSLKDAATALNCSMIGVRDRCCIKNSNKITKFSVITDKSGFITEDCIGKTWNECGWMFEPKDVTHE